MERKKIIVDFDNTMGVEGKDTDDGLAFLYLLGFPEADIQGICTTYGNSTIDVVHDNTVKMLTEMGLDIPLYKGAGSPTDPVSDASHFLVQAAAAEPGQITVMATGSFTNLRGALQEDPEFFSNLAGVYVMGGYTESLPFNGFFVDELNGSCDPDALYDLIAASNVGAPEKPGCPVTAATAQVCLPATFTRAEFDAEFGADSWVMRACSHWFRNMEEHFNWPHAVCWDVVTAAMIMQPELFEPAELAVTLYRRYFSVGYLEAARPGAPQATINVPAIRDRDRFIAEVFAAWHRAIGDVPNVTQ